MKKIDPRLFDALRNKAANIAYGFKLTRKDGFTIGFTSHDASFVYGGLSYDPVNGFNASAAASKNNLSVANINATCLITTAIPEKDLVAGLYDNAKVEVFWICPDHPEYGIMPLRGGRFGELTVKNGQYEVELRAISYFLQQPFGKFYALECSAHLGDDECKVNLNPETWQPNHDYVIKAGADAGIGSWVVPTKPNGFWYWATKTTSGFVSAVASALVVNATNDLGNNNTQTGPFGVVSVTTGNTSQDKALFATGVTVTGSYGNSSAYVTPTKQYAAPASAPTGQMPTTITTWSSKVTYMSARSGAAEPSWPGGGTVTDGSIVWTGYIARRQHGSVTAAFNKGQFEDRAMTLPPAHFFQYGKLTWTSGRNKGLTAEIRDFTLDPHPNFILLEPMPFAILPGDEYDATMGCPKTRGACINTFGNLNNFRGCPDMPTEDRALATPNYTQSGTQSDTSGGS